MGDIIMLIAPYVGILLLILVTVLFVVCCGILVIVLKLYATDKGCSQAMTQLLKDIAEQNARTILRDEHVADRHERMVSILSNVADEILKLRQKDAGK